MEYWQPPPFPRQQIPLFTTTLEDRIPGEHPVRLLDEILARIDWSEWEARYHGRRGQPPIHPRVLASVILYGQMRGFRASRKLEYAINHGIDFIWLVSGRTIDHATLCDFRKKFPKELRQLYRQICRLAVDMGFLHLEAVAIDGSKVKANSNRHKTLTAEKIEAMLAALDQQLEQGLQDADEADADGDDSALDQLPADLADPQQRRAKLQELLQLAQEADRARRRDGIDTTENPAQIPATDPDSRILPNKEGGYAANYTPMAAVDAENGFIVGANVLGAASEQHALLPLLEDIEQTFGKKPESVLADGAYPTGENVKALEEQGIEFYSPLSGPDANAVNPAIREDPTQPVAEEDREKLPINPRNKRLDKSAFIYDEEKDIYRCPQGRELEFKEIKRDTRRGQQTASRVYRSKDCSGCPLIDLCNRSQRGRTVQRDVHEERRQAHARKMATAEAQQRYAKRFHAAEVPFAVLKHILGLRQFLLRGLTNVNSEWLWACSAYNLRKIISLTAAVRAGGSQMAAENG